MNIECSLICKITLFLVAFKEPCPNVTIVNVNTQSPSLLVNLRVQLDYPGRNVLRELAAQNGTHIGTTKKPNRLPRSLFQALRSDKLATNRAIDAC